MLLIIHFAQGDVFMVSKNVKVVLSMLVVCVIWGSVWPLYKLALQYAPPLLFASLRSILGGLLLAVFLLPKWREIHFKKTWHIYAIASIFNVIIFYGVQSIGLQYLPAGLFSVIVYLQPVLVVVLATIIFKESLGINKIIGIILGFVGVVAVSFDGISGEIKMIGIVLALITAAGWAIGTIYVKATSRLVHGLWLVAFQNLTGGLLLFIWGNSVESFSAIHWDIPFMLILLYGSIFGVSLATIIYLNLISTGEAGKVSSFTFLVPLIAVLIGTVFLGEPFTRALFVGMTLILISILLINLKKKNAEILVHE